MSEPSLLLIETTSSGMSSTAAAAPTNSSASQNNNGAGVSNATRCDHYNPMVREVIIPKLASGSCGFDLSRSKWDPYPWVSGIDRDSTAAQTGLRCGDCVLEVNGEDILGLRIAEVAKLVRAKPAAVTLLLWTSGADPRCAPESLCCGPMPLNLDRLSSCLQAILVALECPVCLDTILPPAVQCGNGHLVCARCRSRQGADKCAVCRQRYSVTGGGATGGAGAGANRSLIAEQVYGAITEAFRLRCNAGDSYRVGGNGESSSGRLREQLFGAQCRKRAPAVENMKAVQSHTHKFLARIMGKATSLDGLNRTATGTSSGTSATVSTAMGTDRIERDEVTKQLSLSVNEIFRPNSSAPTSRSTSPQRLQPDVIGSQTFLGTRRPRSHNVSTESLPQHVLAESTAASTSDDISVNVPLPLRHQHAAAAAAAAPRTPIHCPIGGAGDNIIIGVCDGDALKLTATSTLEQHIGLVHSTMPIVWFGVGTHSACLDLPLRLPLAGDGDGMCLVLRLKHDVQCWVRVQRLTNGGSEDDKVAGDNNGAADAIMAPKHSTNTVGNGKYFVTAFLASDTATAAKYHLEVRIGASASALTGRLLQQRGLRNVAMVSREIVACGLVHSLQRKSWQSVRQERDGIAVSEQSIASVFAHCDDASNAESGNGSGGGDVVMMVTIKDALE